MRVSPILIGSVCVLGYLAMVAMSMMPHADHLGGALVLLYLSGLAVIIVIVALLEQIMVAQSRPTLRQLALVEGGIMFFFAGIERFAIVSAGK